MKRRINITLEETMIRLSDQAAKRKGISRSAYISSLISDDIMEYEIRTVYGSRSEDKMPMGFGYSEEY